ncbi:type I restriction endonuclease subunit S [Veillonellaceae bacterium WCA-693-APC-5D-A]|uniref:Type I restriction endonuclease subunit S n=1 Tax=Anaerovibrio slackiae TaxID=2652309 RepID=A0A6I2UHU2_9FIRM|nr:restriction endonuclease subunit S [Anaerovibrio slackiae]MSU08731.1 type I restriction endonuclease subunit S [Anaerovibrio slackiae]
MTINVNDCFFYIKNGANIKQGVISGGIPITRIETLANDTFNRDKMGYAGIHDKKKYTEYILQDGDILMSHINSMAYLGRAVMYKMQKNECIIHGMNLLRLKANRNFILPEYAEYYFKSNTFKKYIKKIAKKSVNQASFSIADLKSIPLFLPNMVEQKKIYNTLNRIDNIISLKNQQLKKLDLLTKSLFVEMFGDTVINPLGWEEHKLEEYIDFLTSGSRGWAKYFVNEENELFLTIKNVKNNKIVLDDIQYIKAPKNKEAERTKVKCGDLLISITADLGRTGVIDKDISSRGAYINQHLSLVRLDQNRINPQYISYYLETDAGKRQFCSKNQNGVKAGLNFDAIKSLNIIVPPIELQDDFVKNIYFIDKHKFPILD